MGATSVTGKGPGAAKNLKGPFNERNWFVPEVNPHVVIAGNDNLVAGALTITFPNPLTGSGTNYIVTVNAMNGQATWVSAKTDNADGDFVSFSVMGTSTPVVQWTVVKAGFGLETA